MGLLIRAGKGMEVVLPKSKQFTLTEMYRLLNCDSVETVKLPRRADNVEWNEKGSRRRTS